MSFSATRSKVKFAESEQGVAAEKTLRALEEDAGYTTATCYSSHTEQYPDNRMPFVDKHMTYLSNHPATDVQHYLSNLRLMTRVR
jgi:pyrroloquinoline quinone (PQQ) biosynthesis protein C